MSEQGPLKPSGAELFATQRVGGGRYVLIKQLGRGGMGVVWLAHDERLDEKVALKFLPQEINSDAAALDDLRRETLRSRKLTHPNIIRIHDLYEARGEASFISMEFVQGQNLIDLRLQRGERVLSWAELKPLLQQLCEALDYAHSEKVIHRDLKPANMMVDLNGRLKLADFGIAATISDATSRVSVRHASSGTLAYMSPQQMDGEIPKVADDIYALGATIYELLTSRPPFFSGDVAYQARHLPPKPMEERLAEFGTQNEIPPDVAALVMACLAKDPSRRPTSARAVAEWIGFELNRSTALKGKSLFDEEQLQPAETTVETSRIEPPVHAGIGKKLALILGTFLVLVVAGAGIFFANRKLASKNPDLLAPPENATAPQKETVAAVNSLASPPPTNGLVLYFNFDEEPQNGIVRDQSGYGNDGHVVGAQWTPDGKRGGGMVFSPDNCHIIVTNNDSLNPERITVAAWIKTARSDHFWRRIIDKSWRTGFALGVEGDYVNWNPPPKGPGHVCIEVGYRSMETDRSLADGNWHHVAATYDGTNLCVYADGQPLCRVVQHKGFVEKNKLDLRIGGFADADERTDDRNASFDGTLDEVMMFNRALSATEIWDLYDSIRAPAVGNPQSTTQASSQLSPPPTNGLVLYFNFDEEPQNGIVRDQSGYGNDGHVVGGQWIPDGKRGGALLLSPSDSSIRVSDNDSLNPAQFSVCAWIKTSRADHFYRRVFDKGLFHDGFTVSIAGDYYKRNPPTKLRGFVEYESVHSASIHSTHSVADGLWHHIAAIYDGREKRLFVDGQLASTAPCSTNLLKNKLDLVIGGFSDPDLRTETADDPHASFDGALDEVMIFNRALSPTEIWNLYDSIPAPTVGSPQSTTQASSQSSPQPTNGLILYYDFDEPPQNGIVLDQSGHGNNGKATGVQWIADGERGGALLLSPTDSSIRVADNESLNPTQFSLCAWIKTSRADHFYRRIFDKGLFHNGFTMSIAGDYAKRVPPTKIRGFVEYESAGNPSQTSIGSVADGSWHYVAATFDGGQKRLFLDGQLQSTARCSNKSLKNNLDLVIGGFTDPHAADDPHASFDGALDEVMIFNRALSNVEIWQLYNYSAQDGTQTHGALTADSIAGKSFVFRWLGTNGSGYNGVALLQKGGTISGIPSPNETYWEIDSAGHLIFKHRDGRVSTIFTTGEERGGMWSFSGPFQFRQGIEHVLEETNYASIH